METEAAHTHTDRGFLLTLQNSTLRSSAPDSAEQLIRHSGSPLTSESRRNKQKSSCEVSQHWEDPSRGTSLTFELQASHGDLSDVGGGLQIVLPDLSVDSQLVQLEDHEGRLLLVDLLLEGEQHLKTEDLDPEQITSNAKERWKRLFTSLTSNSTRTLTVSLSGGPVLVSAIVPLDPDCNGASSCCSGSSAFSVKIKRVFIFRLYKPG